MPPHSKQGVCDVMTCTLMSRLKDSCLDEQTEQDGRWPRSQASYPDCLEVKWEKEFSGDTQKLLFSSKTRLSGAVGCGIGAESVLAGTGRTCSTAFPSQESRMAGLG